MATHVVSPKIAFMPSFTVGGTRLHDVGGFSAAAGTVTLDDAAETIEFTGLIAALPAINVARTVRLYSGLDAHDFTVTITAAGQTVLTQDTPATLPIVASDSHEAETAGVPEANFTTPANFTGSWQIDGVGTASGSWSVPINLPTTLFKTCKLTRAGDGSVSDFTYADSLSGNGEVALWSSRLQNAEIAVASPTVDGVTIPVSVRATFLLISE